MGFSTNVTISNDFWHEIAKDPARLVEAISIGMNEGANGGSPLCDTLDQREDAPEYRRHAYNRRRYQTPQGVTIHRAQHNDVPQVIASTWGNHAIAAHELPHAIEEGWFDTAAGSQRQAEAVATELETLADRIRKAVREAKPVNGS